MTDLAQKNWTIDEAGTVDNGDMVFNITDVRLMSKFTTKAESGEDQWHIELLFISFKHVVTFVDLASRDGLYDVMSGEWKRRLLDALSPRVAPAEEV